MATGPIGRMCLTSLAAVFLFLSSSSPAAAADDSPPQQPNFVLILGEGQGWTSTSVQMDDAVPNSKSGFLRTPNFERLAREGMRLANFYAPSPRCTPSRATFFTGKSPAQLHMTFVSEGKGDSNRGANSRVIPPSSSVELPLGETTVAELLKRAGYATAHFGKWHVGRTSPAEHGFEESDGATNNAGPENVSHPHPKELYGMTDRGLDFMTRQVQAGKPFYLQMSHCASRRSEDALPQTVATVRNWAGDADESLIGEAAATLDLDITLGMILNKLAELGIADDTYVVYTAAYKRALEIYLQLDQSSRGIIMLTRLPGCDSFRMLVLGARCAHPPAVSADPSGLSLVEDLLPGRPRELAKKFRGPRRQRVRGRQAVCYNGLVGEWPLCVQEEVKAVVP